MILYLLFGWYINIILNSIKITVIKLAAITTAILIKKTGVIKILFFFSSIIIIAIVKSLEKITVGVFLYILNFKGESSLCDFLL